MAGIGTFPGWNLNATDRSKQLSGPNSDIAAGTNHLCNLRIAAPQTFFFDEEKFDKQTVSLKPGDILYVTLQGYSGIYTTLQDYNDNWDMSYNLKKGNVTSIEVLNKPFPGFTRSSEIIQSEGSLESADVLNGRQAYLKIVLSDTFDALDDELLLYFRFATKNEGYTYFQKIQQKVNR